MADLKPGWRLVKFGDVVRLNKETSKAPLAEGIDKFVGLEHLEPSDLRIRSWGDVADGTTFTNRFRPGHVLFGKRRAYQRKIAVADFGGVCSGDIYVLESKDPGALLPELLPFLCQTDAFFDHAVGTSAGSLSPRTNWRSLASYEFSLPPLDDQRRIARVLRASNIAVERLGASIQVGDFLEQSCIDAIFGSAPTCSDERIDLGEALTLLKDGDHTPPPGSDPNGVVLLSVSHINKGKLEFDDNERRVPKSHYLDLHKNWKIEPGDLLLTIIGTIGRTALVPPGLPQFTLQRMVAVLRSNPEQLNQGFLHMYCRSTAFKRYCLSRASCTAQPAVYLRDLARAPIVIPPLQEQCRHYDAFETIHAATESLRARMPVAQNLHRAVSSRVFSEPDHEVSA